MAELVDALDLGSSGATRGGSIPPSRTFRAPIRERSRLCSQSRPSFREDGSRSFLGLSPSLGEEKHRASLAHARAVLKLTSTRGHAVSISEARHLVLLFS